jgi:lysophospholipase
MMKSILFLLVFAIGAAHAIPEKNYLETWNNEVMPYFTQGQQRTFINQEGMKLNFYSFNKAENKKTIVILPGRTEPATKYAEMIFDMKDLGFNFFILDHQGQGASDRLLADHHKGHVKKFSNYISDLTGWINEVVVPETQNQERILITHSMGGAIGTIYLSGGSDVFKKAVLCAPMMELNTKPYTEVVGRILAQVLVIAQLGNKYAPDRGPYVPENDTFARNEVTHSGPRFDMAKSLFVDTPELVVGGPTSRWVSQSLKATKKIDELAPKIHIPILMFQSGMDLIVKPSRQSSFCEKNSNCKKIFFPNSHHEILQETDDIRNVAMNEILEFVK